MQDNRISLNYLSDNHRFIVKPLSPKRTWMDKTSDKFAYKCLPLTVANQYGWSVYGPCGFTAEWNGDNSFDSVKVEHDIDENFAASHFGNGVLTLMMDFVIRTNESTSIYVMGEPNFVKNGIVPLNGIIETDWLPFTFTFNYKFTTPGTVRFEKEEPLFSFFPIQRGYIESFSTSINSIEDDEDFYSDYKEYTKLRQDYLADNPGTFQRFYTKKALPEKSFDVKDHTIKVKIQDFNIGRNI